MKKLLFLACFVLIGGALMAAAPTNNSTTSTTAAFTVDSSHAAEWQKLDSVIMVITDTATAYYTYALITTLYPGQTLYLSLNRSASADSIQVADTISYPEGFEGPFRVRLGNYFSYLYESQTDKTDTVYLKGAVGGTTEYENMICSTIVINGTVLNYDAP